MADQEPHTGPPTREARRGVSESRDREPRNREPRKSGNSGGRSAPFGLKPGLLAGVSEALKFYLSAAIGILVVSFVFAMVYGSAISAGWLSTEGGDAWFTVLSWLLLMWLFGQWLKARFGRSNKLFRER